jgi:cation diffusion facilitator family transporter
VKLSNTLKIKLFEKGAFFMSSGGSTKVIVIAFFANLGIAIAKFFGAFISGSAALLAEAIHSLVDCSNQILLIIGSKKSQKPPDKNHPLGYGREAFFWSFIVAILLFSLGGLFAIYEGTHKLHSHEDLKLPELGMGILLFGLILESYSFWTCIKEIRAQNQFKSFVHWFKNTKNSELLVIFTEDAAALCGLLIALIFLGIAWTTGNSLWDAIGSIVVGVILVVVAILLAVEIKSFIIGESSTDDIRDFVIQTVPDIFPAGRVLNIITLQMGSNESLLSCKIFPGSVKDVGQAIALTNQLEKLTKSKFPELRWQFLELDNQD